MAALSVHPLWESHHTLDRVLGKSPLFREDPGEGKTTMVLQLIARLTRGEAIFPEEETKNKQNQKEHLLRSVSDGGGMVWAIPLNPD